MQIDVGGLNENARDRNRLCIEDPFETPYNVARTVTKDGLYTVCITSTFPRWGFGLNFCVVQ